MSDGSPTHPGRHPTFHNSEDEWADDPDADEDDLEDGDSDGDSIGEREPVVLGTKRPSDTQFEDPIMPKVKKSMDGSAQRLKASDFDDITKEILTTAITIFRCLVVTRAPFPDSILIETKLAKEAWREACSAKGINVRLTPGLMKMVSCLIL